MQRPCKFEAAVKDKKNVMKKHACLLFIAVSIVFIVLAIVLIAGSPELVLTRGPNAPDSPQIYRMKANEDGGTAEKERARKTYQETPLRVAGIITVSAMHIDHYPLETQVTR